jgi:tetratricopeptide (TPR) repeat protein
MRILPAGLMLALCACATAQNDDESAVTLYVEEEQARPLLDQAATAEAAGRWDLAIERYQKVLRDYPDQLRRGKKTDTTWTSVRRHIFERVSKLPPEGRKVYLDMNDAIADSIYQTALKDRDDRALERVATEYFFTSTGDDAAVRLAGWFAETGRVQDASFLLERTATLHPEPDVPMAEVLVQWAALCRRLGDEAGWQEAERRLKGKAGTKILLGGREATVDEALERLRRLGPAPRRTARADEWPRLGGNNAATQKSPGESGNDIRLWAFPELNDAQRKERDAMGVRRNPGNPRNPQGGPMLHFYPAVAGGKVYLSDGVMLICLSLENGATDFCIPEHANPGDLFVKANRGMPRVMSLAAPVVHEGVVYTNFLPSEVQQGGETRKVSWLEARSCATSRELWSTRSIEALDGRWFGSPPVIYGGRVWAAVTNSDPGEDPTVWLLCLDAATGRLLKDTFLCSGTRSNMWGIEVAEAPMLAESGGVLYVCTNLGAVAAAQACTGEILWLTSYENPRERNPRSRFEPVVRNGRGLSPVVIDAGRVCVMPGDSPDYLEFDAKTGRKLSAQGAAWSKDKGRPREDRNLPHYFLGVSGENAFFTGSVGAWTLPLSRPGNPGSAEATGVRLTTNSAESGSTGGFVGRPFFSESRLYASQAKGFFGWNARTLKLEVKKDWTQSEFDSNAGHVVMAGGRLLVVNRFGVVCFTDTASFNERFADALREDNPNLERLEEHAKVMSMNRNTRPEAIRDYERLAALSKDAARANRARLMLVTLHRETADAALGRAFAKEATAETRKAAVTEALGHYRAALAADPDGPVVGDLYRLMGRCHEGLEEWGKAVLMYHEAAKQYGNELISEIDGLVQPMKEFAEKRIREIIQQQGPEVYGEVERKAKEVFEKAKSGEGLDELLDWWEAFPNSRLAAPAAFEIAARYEAAGRSAEAAAALLRLADRDPGAPEAAQALAQAAATLSALGEWARVMSVLIRLERKHRGATVTIAGRQETAESFAAAVRALEPAEAAGLPAAKAALWREWGTDPDDVAFIANPGFGMDPEPRVFVPRGRWSGVDPETTIFIYRMNALEAWDAAAGTKKWTAWDGRGWLGVSWADTSDIYNLGFGDVVANTPASRGGVKPGDVAVFWNGTRLRSVPQLKRHITMSAGREIELKVLREGAIVPLKITIGRRERLNTANEIIIDAVFSECGLLLVGRPSTIEAWDPATGELRWVYAPAHPGAAQMARFEVADDRAFIAWTRTNNAQMDGGVPVSLEAVDALTGRPLWRHTGDRPAIAQLHAVPGTGLLVVMETGGQKREIQVISARTGAQERPPIPVVATASAQFVAGLQESRLIFMPTPGVLASWDLITGEETQVDLGGRREPPVSARFERGWAVLEQTTTRLLAVPLPLDPAAARVQVILPSGHLPFPGGTMMGPGNRLLVMTSAENAPNNRQIQRFQLGPEGIQDTSRISMTTIKGPAGFLPGVAGHTFLWGCSDDRETMQAVLMLHSDAGGKIAWSAERPADEAAGKFVTAGIRGKMVWVQYEKKVVLLK